MNEDFEKDLFNTFNNFFQKWGLSEIGAPIKGEDQVTGEVVQMNAYDLVLDIGVSEKKMRVIASNGLFSIPVLPGIKIDKHYQQQFKDKKEMEHLADPVNYHSLIATEIIDRQFERDLYSAISNIFNLYSIPLSSQDLILNDKTSVAGDRFEIIFDLDKNECGVYGIPYYEEKYTVEILPSLLMRGRQRKLLDSFKNLKKLNVFSYKWRHERGYFTLVRPYEKTTLDPSCWQNEGMDIESWLASYPHVWEGLSPNQVVRIAEMVFDKVAYPEEWNKERKENE